MATRTTTAVWAAAVTILGGTLMSGAAYAQEPAAAATAPNGITVQGTGEVRVRPDLARLTLGVQTQNKDSQLAARDNAARTDALIKAVRAAGVAEKDVQTSGYNIGPQFDYRPNESPRLTGYQVSNTVTVTVRKIADVGKVIDAAVKAGANVALGIAFDLNETDKQKAEEEALTRAVADARRKATVIARAQGTASRSIRLTSITENAGGFARPFADQFANVRMAKAEAGTPVEAGEQTISASVTARYAFTAAPEEIAP